MKKESWITDEILQLMGKRRLAENDPDEYKNINKIIQKKIREAKDNEMMEKCAEIEAPQEKHDKFNVHWKVKDIKKNKSKRKKMKKAKYIRKIDCINWWMKKES